MSEIIGIFNDASTGEVIERPLTEEELVHYNLALQDSAKIQEEVQKKLNDFQSAKEKLAKLGLTEDEISAIVGGI